jgi:nucleoid DNA-binding protein
MGKLTIQEIAKILVDKNKLTPKEANQFAAAMFEIIQQQLSHDELVKVKGLGTFKMIRVEPRESVSVRTGERVMIDSHAKVTFTPDATMKELVNKPFSHFETVILNEGVEFDDLADELTEEEAAELDNMESEESVEPAVVQPLLDIVDDTPAVEEEKETVVEEPQTEEPITEEPITEEPQTEESITEEPHTEETSDVYEDEETGSWKKSLGYGLLTLALMAGSAYGGYWYGQKTANVIVEETVVEVPEVIVADSVSTDMTNDTTTVAEDSVVRKPATETSVIEQPKSEVKQEQITEEEPFWKKYEKMDARVRTGAYHIVGTDHEVQVRKGETLSRIARRELGEGMSCYIEVYNNLKSNSELQEGQTIKIPKLKWKKQRRTE